MREHSGTHPSIYGGVVDLESFQACIEEVKKEAETSTKKPYLHEVLGEVASSQHPILEGDIFQAFQRILKEKHRALRVLQAKTRASFIEEETHQLIDEYPTEADKLQIRSEGIQLGCLLVQKTQGETQLQVTRWLQTANAWEAWRQLNLQCTTSKWSVYFQLLTSIMNTNFDTQPVSFLQQFSAWKERVVKYQQLSGDKLPDLVKLIAVVNGWQGSVRNFVLLNLRESSFGDLDSLLTSYMHDQHKPSLESSCERACKHRSKSRKGNDKESNPSFKQQLEEGGTTKREVKRQEKGTQATRKGGAYHPQPPAYRGKWEHAQLPKEQWCSLCRKKGTGFKLAGGIATSSINSNTNNIKPSADIIISRSFRTEAPASALPLRSADNLYQPGSRRSIHVELRASTSSFNSLRLTPNILVDTGAATSVAPQSFASGIALSSAPSTLQLTTATGTAVRTYGLKQVHLQSQGLSLEVTFVIADVVTPLLGLDSLIKDRLSLHVDQDFQHFIVNPTGGKTQLEHMGRHLYLIACPSQHGLPQCSPGNLSHVIGFLHEDKEYHEQKVAFRSSSRFDRDEDTNQQLVQQDSLIFLCQQVLQPACDAKNDPSFDLMPSKGAVAVSGGELSPYLQTKQPSTHERKLHNQDPIHLEHGCEVPQEAKGRASSKASIHLAYAYIRQSEDCEPTSLLMWLESFTGLAGSLIMTEKGPTA